jgi:hypothetical protein
MFPLQTLLAISLRVWHHLPYRAILRNTNILPFDSWEHLRVPLKDVSIHVRYHGSGPPIFLVHGVPQHSVSLSPLLQIDYVLNANRS